MRSMPMPQPVIERCQATRTDFAINDYRVAAVSLFICIATTQSMDNDMRKGARYCDRWAARGGVNCAVEQWRLVSDHCGLGEWRVPRYGGRLL